MKASIFVLTLSLTLNTWAAPNSENDLSFDFKFQPYLGQSFRYSVKAKDQFEALERAAQACFSHFKGKRRISSDEGQDIIDICVNPRII